MMAELTVNPSVTTPVVIKPLEDVTTQAETSPPTTDVVAEAPPADPVVVDATEQRTGANELAAQNAAALVQPEAPPEAVTPSNTTIQAQAEISTVQATAVNPVTGQPVQQPIPRLVESGGREGVTVGSHFGIPGFIVSPEPRDAKITEAVNGNPNLTPEQRTQGLATLAQQNQARQTEQNKKNRELQDINTRLTELESDPHLTMERDLLKLFVSQNWDTSVAAGKQLNQLRADANYQARFAERAMLKSWIPIVNERYAPTINS